MARRGVATRGVSIALVIEGDEREIVLVVICEMMRDYSDACAVLHVAWLESVGEP